MVWILKETNDLRYGLHKYILDKIIQKKPSKNFRPQTFYKIGVATAALLWPHASKKELKAKKRHTLRHIAVINMKKSPGTAKADIDTIVELLKKDADFLKRQLELLKPRVIVVGGMKSSRRIKKELIDMLRLEKVEGKKDLYYSPMLNAHLISTHHPAYTKLTYKKLIDEFRGFAESICGADLAGAK